MGKKIFVHVAALALLAFTVVPLLLVLMSSVLPDASILSFPPRWFTRRPTLAYYDYIFTGQRPEAYELRGAERGMITEEVRQVPRGMGVSATVAVMVMAVNMVFGSMAAYSFARLRFRGKAATFSGIVMCRLLPAAALAVPFYLIIQGLGLLDTKLALVLVHSILTLPFTVLILTVFFRTIPVEIEEAAKIDGSGPWGTFWRITLPLSASSLVAVGLFSFMLSYSEFLYSNILGGSERTRTLPVIMAALSTNTD
ncbi:MAG TPA: carbohydrate ABC transporter permease, partial [Anaerolineales bacterium]|nr:carbohydrate ABC transporter permease [Anaerolineales bacterium]